MGRNVPENVGREVKFKEIEYLMAKTRQNFEKTRLNLTVAYPVKFSNKISRFF